MKCSNCGVELEEGQKFCFECGTPVPQTKKCIKCGAELSLKMKFCPECGTNQEGKSSASSSGIAIGDKNVISGDVIGKKEEYKVSGNATIVHNEDETKKTKKCHICGSIVQIIQGYECSYCGEFTCSDCFDTENKICSECAETSKKSNIEKYKATLKEFVWNDGKIDIEEREELVKLQKKFGITDEQAADFEKQEKQAYFGSNVNELTTFEKINLEKAEKFFYEEGSFNEAFEFIKQIYQNHKTDRKVLDLYFPILAEVNPKKLKEIKEYLSFDNLQLYLALIRIAIKNEELNEAERLLKITEKMWTENTLVKCHQILFYIAMYKKVQQKEFLNKVNELSQNLGETNDKLELSWQMYTQLVVNDVNGNPKIEITKDFCKENGIYWFFIKKYNLSS